MNKQQTEQQLTQEEISLGRFYAWLHERAEQLRRSELARWRKCSNCDATYSGDRVCPECGYENE